MQEFPEWCSWFIQYFYFWFWKSSILILWLSYYRGLVILWAWTSHSKFLSLYNLKVKEFPHGIVEANERPYKKICGIIKIVRLPPIVAELLPAVKFKKTKNSPCCLLPRAATGRSSLRGSVMQIYADWSKFSPYAFCLGLYVRAQLYSLRTSSPRSKITQSLFGSPVLKDSQPGQQLWNKALSRRELHRASSLAFLGLSTHVSVPSLSGLDFMTINDLLWVGRDVWTSNCSL